MFMPFGQTWVRLRAGRRPGAYSDREVLDWANPDELPIDGCHTDPGSSIEGSAVDLQTLTTTRTWFGPPGADVRAGDRLRDPRGIVWTVEGMPDDKAQDPHPFTGWAPYTSAIIRTGKSLSGGN